jgi:hypothetical protein
LTSDDDTRPEVVQALFQALIEMDDSALLHLEGTAITPAERAAAENLYLAAAPANLGHRKRKVEAIRLLAGDGGLAGNPTWAELFDRLPAERVPQLADLYDALPDAARAEYDRRYGQPPLS